MTKQLNDVVILVNNTQVAYTADSITYKDGFGEYTVRNAVVGGSQTEQIFSQDLSTKVGMVKFSMPSTKENDDLKRAWKLNLDENVVELVGPDNFTKVFTQAVLTVDPEGSLSTDGNIEVEFMGRPAQ